MSLDKKQLMGMFCPKTILSLVARVSEKAGSISCRKTNTPSKQKVRYIFSHPSQKGCIFAIDFLSVAEFITIVAWLKLQ